MRDRIRRSIVLILAAALILPLMTACVNTRPVLHPELTAEPTRRAGAPTPVPEDNGDVFVSGEPTEAPTPAPTEPIDMMGNPVTGPEHYIRYLRFENVLVYEEEGDTFMDCIIENTYLITISCAVDIVFRDEDGEEIARARLQTRDGSYLLQLPPGETVAFARILTDMTLTSSEFTFEFDKDTAIRPVPSLGAN